MRSTWWILGAVLVFGAPAPADAYDAIALFSDTRGCPCEITDRAGTPGLINIAVLQVNTPGAKASQFSAPMPACFGALYITETPIFPITIGNSQDGIAIGYGGCRTGTFQILNIVFFGQGLTPDCCFYPLLPDPYAASGRIEVVDCDDEVVFASGWGDMINMTSQCVCLVGLEHCYPVATERATWGKIKALYE
ncbi:MAG: hypothetical protein JSW50_16445 [Candidatus Latescibacterota bacterium]|nr:MAG: hypothetical protein JSW50_16445 [Candidatus Latescibacterota bacterium]